ncbi:C40 family peptidase [Mumia sp. ZJ430]|uniref:C40 family peptidase n=1 Tax=Mumia sp. ZJ430 TaxID=2708083 RepID=UPI001420AED5|nr:C40 family peptidase [Mumia sp. ZJ430]
MRLATDRSARRVAPLFAVAALVLAGTPAVHADETPSAHDVRDARAGVATKSGDVTDIRARIAAATARVDALAVDAAQAAEAYNGAQYALEEASATARSAQKAAQTAARDAEAQRLVVERLTVAGVTARAPYHRIRSFFSGGGPSSLLGQMSSYNAVGDASRAALATYESKRAVAVTLKREADAALARREKLAAAATKAKHDTEKAVAGAAAARAGLQRDRDQLIRELANADGISVKLASRRQKALEQLAQQAQEAANRPQTGAPSLPPTDSPAPSPAPAPPTLDPDADPPKQAKGVEAAVRFALTQVGEPYVWAGAGPDVWDCSGLTMRAWQAAGKGLPHFSGAQYAVSAPIAVPEARRGDLLFWSRGGPDSIHHVALYLGDGWMVEAPRPGKNVQVVSVYSWTAPDLAARVR